MRLFAQEQRFGFVLFILSAIDFNHLYELIVHCTCITLRQFSILLLCSIKVT